MRRFSRFATDNAKSLLDRLTSKADPTAYRDTMTRIGMELGALSARQFAQSARCLLICTNEDADFLARGVLEELSEHGADDVHVACFWNDRVRDPAKKIDVAPILRSYLEPAEQVDTFIVVKSIISSACVVRTNITELVYQYKPQQILIVAPVLLRGARQRLEVEFPGDISKRFDYLWFAEDDKAGPDGTVIPGIGGSVYERLGIGTAVTKNSYVPDLVKKRRLRYHRAAASD